MLGATHVYRSPTSSDPMLFGSSYFDPEGILGALNAAFLCVITLTTLLACTNQDTLLWVWLLKTRLTRRVF